MIKTQKNKPPTEKPFLSGAAIMIIIANKKYLNYLFSRRLPSGILFQALVEVDNCFGEGEEFRFTSFETSTCVFEYVDEL